MARTSSTMLELGTIAPDFVLSDANGSTFQLSSQRIDKGLLVVFMCNHCPFVMHIRDVLVQKIAEYQDLGISVVAINSNDYIAWPDDSPENMLKDSARFGYTFPYLIDENQMVAKAYRAACTPDFYLFDADRKLVYRGQFDSSLPERGQPVCGDDLNVAVTMLVNEGSVSSRQQPSIGCSIKWKKGNEPDYFIQ